MKIAGSSFGLDAPLELRDEEVQLWRVDLESIRSQELRWQELLSPDEKKRAARFHFSTDRQNFVAARAILRKLLAAYLADEPAKLSFSYSKKEKPFLSPPHAGSGITFNVSHSGGAALFGFARKRDIGVDIEHIRHDVDAEAIARRFFSSHEQKQLSALSGAKKIEAFFRCWTRKEAYIKATGDGLSLPLSQFDVSLEEESVDALVTTRMDPAEAKDWLLQEVAAGDGYVGAICARGRTWRLTQWSADL